MRSIRQFEQAAIRAHDAGQSFSQFWEEHESEVRAAIPHDSRRFGTVYRHLLALVAAGDLDNLEPPGSDECSWEADDERSKPHDTQTAARWQGMF